MRRFLTITFITLFILLGMAINVQAADVAERDEFAEALTNTTDDTVTLTADIVGGAEPLTITGNKTLNLNGKTLTLQDSLVVNGGKLTITGNGKVVTEVSDPMIHVLNGGTLTLENGTYESETYYGAAVQVTGAATNTDVETKVNIGKDVSITANYPVFIPKEGAFGVVIDVYGKLKSVPTTNENGKTQYGAALYINGGITATSGKIPVINIYEGATVLGEETEAIYAAGYGIWNISGGYLEGTDAVSIKGGEFNITGGTFKAYGEFDQDPAPNGNGSEATGSAISITGNSGYAGKVKLNISNATVTSENGYAVYETITSAVQPAVESMTITSGDFSGKAGALQADNIENFVQGGTFSSEVDSKYLSSTVESTEENGVVLVGTKNAIKIEKTENGTVTSSLTEAIKGQTVTLTVTPAEGYKLKTLTVNGEAVTGTTFTMPDEEATVKAEFEKIPVEEEKDDEPKMGSINTSTYAWVTLAAIALVGIITTKKSSKHSK